MRREIQDIRIIFDWPVRAVAILTGLTGRTATGVIVIAPTWITGWVGTGGRGITATGIAMIGVWVVAI